MCEVLFIMNIGMSLSVALIPLGAREMVLRAKGGIRLARVPQSLQDLKVGLGVGGREKGREMIRWYRRTMTFDLKHLFPFQAQSSTHLRPKELPVLDFLSLVSIPVNPEVSVESGQQRPDD